MKYKNDKLEFQINVPQVITLDTDPLKAKEYQKEYQKDDGSGVNVVKSWMYFASGNKIFFASEALHNKLTAFHRGDIIAITKTQLPGQRSFTWNVSADTENLRKEAVDDQSRINNTILNELAEQKKILLAIYNVVIGKDQESPEEKTQMEETKSNGGTFDPALGF